MDNFNLIMKEIKRYRNIEIPKLVGRIRRQSVIFQNFFPLIKIIKSFYNFEREPWRIIAVDGGTDHTSLEGVGFAVASARAFTITLGKTTVSDKNNVQLFDIPASEIASIVSSTFMKSLEYSVALEAVSSITDEISTIVLLDGSLTFPDTSVGNTKIPELSEAFSKYVKNSNKFFEYIVKRHNLYVISVSKDARRAKYLRALLKDKGLLSKITNFQTFKDEIINLLNNESWRERVALQYAMRKKSPRQPSFFEPVNVTVQGVTHGNTPIYLLDREGILGTYYLFPEATHALYLEIPKWNEEKIEQLLKVFNELCRLSPIRGYPYPLVYVDLLTRVTKSLSSKLFAQLIYEIRNIAPDIAKDVVASQMRELLH